MPARRILSVWFPRLGADRLQRRMGETQERPLAVVGHEGRAQVLTSVSALAESAGLRAGMPLRDACAICSELVTRTRHEQAEAAFLAALARWADRFSPWVATQAPDSLMLDITGCAHLFGGEAELMAAVIEGAADLGLAARGGLADTQGAAWALARYAGVAPAHVHAGDAIDQEARATRSRAAKRRHSAARGAPAAETGGDTTQAGRIAAPGQTHGALAGLPVAALRLDDGTVTQLARLGLRRIGDLTGQPRAPLARRFGRELLLRLDQAMGAVPDPVSPAGPPPRFAARLTLPDPIGLREDMLAALDRLVPGLCKLLKDRENGARLLRLQAFRSDGGTQTVDIGLARASNRPDDMRPLLEMKLDQIDAGYGIDTLRLEAVRTEPVHARQMTGHAEAAKAARARVAGEMALDDLMGRIGARIGMDAITRRHPVSSHIPEKTWKTLAAAWSEPASDWPPPLTPRPLLIWRPELVQAPDHPRLSDTFRWRGRTHALACATGPERIAPEWWLDEPEWRTGVRDYWQVITEEGARLWLFYAHGGTKSSGWFCQGRFA